MSDAANPSLPPLGFAKDSLAEEREAMSAFGDFTAADPGEVLIQEGAPQDSLHLVVSGTVHVQTAQAGRNILLTSLRSGDTIGEMNMFDQGPASATVEAHEFAVLWSISRSKWDAFMAANPVISGKVLLSLATLLTKRLRTTNEKVAVAQNLMGGKS